VLPPESFSDPEALKRELDTLFRAHWLFVPQRPAGELRDDHRSLADLVARKGSRAPFSLLDRPLFLQRDWKGRLHCFPNVCTHAWHTLVQGPDRQRTLLCPQHGRQFDCEGRYLNQPGFEKLQPRPCDHLADFPAEAWGPFIFTCLGIPAAPFSRVFGPMIESLKFLPIDKLTRRPVSGEIRQVPGNWKLHAWNYMDSLHLPHIHKKPGGLADLVELSTYRTELHDYSALQSARARNPEHAFSKRNPAFALWWFVFPNLAINVYPWGISVNVFSPIPGDPTHTLFLWYHYVLDERKYERREEIWALSHTDLEDVDAMSQVARGIASGFAPPGRFAPGVEDGPRWFHERVRTETLDRANPNP
jgi:choline monooxygenase